METKISVHGPLYKVLPRKKIILLLGYRDESHAWDKKAIEILQNSNIDAFVVNPFQGENGQSPYYYNRFYTINDWIDWYIDLARKNGGIFLFWFSQQDQDAHNSITITDPKHTLAKLLVRDKYFSCIDFAIGIDQNYQDRKGLRGSIQDLFPGFTINNTLEQTCEKVVALCKQKI